MHVEPPAVEVTAAIALVLPKASVVTHRVVAVAARGDHECVEVAESYLVYLLVIELK